MKVLIIEAHAGIAGDMFVAAAASLAGCEEEVAALPAKLGLDGVTVCFRDVDRASMRCRRFDVLEGDRPAEDAAHHHHHDHGHAHGHHHHDHLHGHDHGHHHGHHHDHHHDHDHHHRSLSHIHGLIDRAELEPAIRERAKRMFQRLGEVEAAAHGVPVESIHFHEVGAVDAIVDIVAAALCIERLGIAASYCSPVCVGSGTVRCAHGIMPVPAPATEALLRGMPTVTGDIPGEWTTPTGALILAELQPGFEQPAIVGGASAFGAGGKDTPQRPNAVRLRLATATGPRSTDGLERDRVVQLVCQIDDSPGELLGADLIARLLSAGARDAWLTPVLMKKGRPGQLLEVLVDPPLGDRLVAVVLTETSSIGLRRQEVERLKLPRESCEVITPWGSVAAKRVHLPDGSQRIRPEYEACHALAERSGISLQRIYAAALGAD